MPSKVFIGMPVYNGQRYLREALDSLLGQSFRDFTILISDDASTDDTPSIIREYSARDPRIQIVRQKQNIGLFKNFGYTLEKADCPFFMWAAQDDIREKDYLSICVRRLEEDSSLGLAATLMGGIDFSGKDILEEKDLLKLSGKKWWGGVARYILQPEVLGKCNLMYGLFRTEAARAAWKAYPQRAAWGQDYLFSLALVSRYNIYVDHRALFKKRGGGFSSPAHLLNSEGVSLYVMNLKNPKNGMFPFGRFSSYFRGHMEALRGTPYRPLAAILLAARLPRAFMLHVKERNFRRFFCKTFN